MLVKFTMESWPWVEKQKLIWQELRQRYPQKSFLSGEQFPVLGIDHSLQLRLTANRKGSVRHENGRLIVDVPEKYASSQEASQNYIRNQVRAYFEDLGRRVISERLHHFSCKLQLFPKEVSYRCQKTRWGSCSSSGHISFNWRLSAAPIEIIDYVVVHELMHLKHPNHSRKFWKAVESEIPKWKKIRHWLSENQYTFDFLAEKSELHES
jgi:predicted metal-dependent hydrolase